MRASGSYHENDQSERDIAFQFIARADHGALGHVRVRRDNFLDRFVESRCPAALLTSMNKKKAEQYWSCFLLAA